MTNEQRVDKVASLLKAIAHPVRVQILLLTAAEECSVPTLLKELSIEQSLLSHHLNTMRTKGVLRARRQRTNVFYRLADPAFVEALNALLASPLIPA